MKTAKQISLTTLLSLALVVAAGFAYKPVAHSSTINQASNMETVTITAMRMTAEQKAAFDQEQKEMQSVTVVGKAMTNAQKAAYDRANNV